MIVECWGCQAVVNGEVRGAYERFDDESMLTARYTLLACPNCGCPTVTIQLDTGPDVEGYEWDAPAVCLPRPETINASIPDPIVSAYQEARNCFRAKAYTATAIMCRKTLEGIADAHKIHKRNLTESLKEMKERDIIEHRLYDWADALRISGNEAAHGVGVETSAQDARDILEFTNALLEYVFTFRDKFEHWKARKATRKNPPPAAQEDNQFA